MAKAYATPYLQNNSTTATATRAAETMTVPSSGMSASGGTIIGWFTFVNSQTGVSGSPTFRAFADNNESFTIFSNGTSIYVKAGATQSYVSSSSSLSSGSHSLALTWNGTNAFFYLDGTSYGGTLPQGSTTFGDSVWVGSDILGGQPLDGSISNLAFFNRALTPQEIYSLYASTQPLVDALATPISPAEQSLNSVVSSPDSNDNYTVATYRRRDNSIESVATLSGTPSPSGSSNYPTLTIQHYDATGTVVTETVTYALTYDANDKIVSKVIQ